MFNDCPVCHKSLSLKRTTISHISWIICGPNSPSHYSVALKNNSIISETIRTETFEILRTNHSITVYTLDGTPVLTFSKDKELSKLDSDNKIRRYIALL